MPRASVDSVVPSIIDIESLLEPVSRPEPAGPDLAYAPDLRDLERAVIDAVAQWPPIAREWRRIARAAALLSQRTKDLRVAVILTRALVATEGWAGLRDGLAFILGLLDRFWISLHPRLDLDGKNDSIWRLNILTELGNPNGLIRDLYAAPLLGGARDRAASLADLDKAFSTGEEGTFEVSARIEIEAMFRAADKREVYEMFMVLQEATEHLIALEALLYERTGRNTDEMRARLADVLERAMRQLQGGLQRGDLDLSLVEVPSDLTVDLKLESVEDFNPERIAKLVPALKELLVARSALKELVEERDSRVNDAAAEAAGPFEDLKGAAPELMPPQEEPARVVDEDVQFTVYRPRSLVAERWHNLIAFAHLSERREDAPEDEPDPVEEVYRQAMSVLGEEAAEYEALTNDSTDAIPERGQLTFVPYVPGIEFNPGSRSFRWTEAVHRESFRMRARATVAGKRARGHLSVFLGSILIGEVSLSFRVTAAGQPGQQREQVEPSRARPYRKIFPSYAHADAVIVEQFERFAESLGDAYLRDVTALRAGEVWDERLGELIAEADVFQLFWSTRSMASSFVRSEWERALALERNHFIRPVYWQDPLPERPEEDLPPPALRRLHFQRIAWALPVASTESEEELNTLAELTPPPEPQIQREELGRPEHEHIRRAEEASRRQHGREVQERQIRHEELERLEDEFIKQVLEEQHLKIRRVQPLEEELIRREREEAEVKRKRTAKRSESIHQKLGRVRRPRVHITYDVDTYGASGQVELPFVMGVLADFSGNPKDPLSPVADRKFIGIDRDNFDQVLSRMTPELHMRVNNRLADNDSDLVVDLKFSSIEDFGPAGVVRQVEPLNRLLETRKKLRDLLAKVDSFEELEPLLEQILQDREGLQRLVHDLAIEHIGKIGDAREKRDALPKESADIPVEETAEESSLLNKTILVTKKTDPLRAKELLRTFSEMARAGAVDWSKTVPHAVGDTIAAIDRKLSEQLAEIMHTAKFSQLEGAWRGLHYLVLNTETNSLLKLKVLNISKDELLLDLDEAIEVHQSAIFEKLYDNEFGMPGGEPFGALIGVYEFTNQPEDMTLLTKMSSVAAEAFCPFISAASPNLMGFDSWTELTEPYDMEKIFESADYRQWHSFRERDEAGFVVLTMPRVLARLPYGANTRAIEEFEYEELRDEARGKPRPEPHDQFCWMNAAYALAGQLTEAFSKYGWCAQIHGAQGGKVKGLPFHVFVSDDGGTSVRGPTEIGITVRQDVELSRLGLLPLCHYKNTDYAVFLGAQTTQRPKIYDRPEAMADAAIAARLPCRMATGRFAHYIKVMARDKIGSFMDCADVEAWLNRWVQNYVNGNLDISKEMKAKYPLADAKIVVEEVPDKPGAYQALAWLRPWLQSEELTASLRLVIRIPGDFA